MVLAAGSVYLVPVPIGNLGDITLRALDTLKQADLIAAEDTRKTRFLLDHYQIQPARLLSLHKYNEKKRLAEILELLESGRTIAVVSDAGSPGVSDPAMLLVRFCLDAGFRVIPLPGPTALIPALTASGMDTGGFLFLGFLPLKAKDRAIALERIRTSPFTTVLYEAPHRVRKTLEDLYASCGDRKVCVARELTKIYEEFVRGKLSGILADYQITEKGEFVVIIDGVPQAEETSEAEIIRILKEELENSRSLRDVADQAARLCGISRNRAYEMALKLRGTKK